MHTYENPIIPGFYPDPGIPLWHSKDLANREQIGCYFSAEALK